MKESIHSQSSFKAGYVAIIGKTNVGKSTLMNAFLKHKLAIVTPKPQTTRNRTLGILNGDNYQIILLDTPGFMQPRYLLQKAMIKTALKTMYETDLILMMVDAADIGPIDEGVAESLKKIDITKFLIINKIDKISKKQILPVIDHFRQSELFQEIVPISALKEIKLDELLSLILEVLPKGEPFYPPEILSSEPERFFVSEIIREQIFYQYDKEIPYATSVQIETFEERPGKKDYIVAKITVERNSQKKILIGKNGTALKNVGSKARKTIEQFLDRPVFLKLEVRVREKWRKKAIYIKEMGYS
jgi:GTP-binding protein Era